MGIVIDPALEQQALRDATGRHDLIFVVNAKADPHLLQEDYYMRYQIRAIQDGVVMEYTGLQEGYDRAKEIERWAS